MSVTRKFLAELSIKVWTIMYRIPDAECDIEKFFDIAAR